MPGLDKRMRHAAFGLAVLCLVLADLAPGAAAAPPVLTPLPAFDSGMDGLYSAAFSPDGGLLATVCVCSPPLTVFAVGADGSLTPVTERLFGSLPSPPAVAFSPDGRLLATGEPGGSYSEIWMYAVAPSGTLTPVGSFPTGPDFESLAFSPDGRLLATANMGNDTVSTFTVGADGALTSVGSFATGHWPRALAFSPDGRVLATANWGGRSVSTFTVGADGTLAPVATLGAGGGGPVSLAFSPDGHLLATANEAGAPVALFTVGDDGALTAAPAPTTDSDPGAVAFSPDGHLFVVADHTTVSEYAVGPGADLTPIGAPLPTEAEYPSWMAFSPLGGLLAVVSTNQTTSQIGTISEFTYPIGPPTATIVSPGDGRTFAVGQAVPTSFTCADSELGIGIASCTDSGGAADGTGSLDTSRPGTFAYTVTAKSRDGQTGTTSIAYTVAGPAPPTPNPTPTTTPGPGAGRTAVRISGVRLHGATVTWCKGCTYPRTRLTFRLSADAGVRVALQRRDHGRFRQLAVATLHGKKGSNSFSVGRRWHQRLQPHRPTRLVVQLRAGGGWTTEKALKLAVRSA